jgi:hypothetical protein
MMGLIHANNYIPDQYEKYIDMRKLSLVNRSWYHAASRYKTLYMDIQETERLVRVTCGMQLQKITGVDRWNTIKDLVLGVDDGCGVDEVVDQLARLVEVRLTSLSVHDTQRLDRIFRVCKRVEKLAIPYMYQDMFQMVNTPVIIKGFSNLTHLEISPDVTSLVDDNYLDQLEMPHLQSFTIFVHVNRRRAQHEIPFDDMLEIFQTIAIKCRTISHLSIGWNDPRPLIPLLLDPFIRQCPDISSLVLDCPNSIISMIDLVDPLNRIYCLKRLDIKSSITPCSLDLFQFRYLRHLGILHYGRQRLDLGGMEMGERITSIVVCNVSKETLEGIVLGKYPNLKHLKVLYRVDDEDTAYFDTVLRQKLRESRESVNVGIDCISIS